MPDDEKQYLIGDRTMAAVFRPNGLTNLSDLQAVFDAVEKALTPDEVSVEDLMIKVGYRVIKADGAEDFELQLRNAADKGFQLSHFQAVSRGGTGFRLYGVIEKPGILSAKIEEAAEMAVSISVDLPKDDGPQAA